MRSWKLYKGQELPALSLAAFGLQRCEGCRLLVHIDDIDSREDGEFCTGCRDKQFAEMEAEFAWMKPHVAREIAARRAGDIETAEAIKHDVLRHDSPFDPANRRSL